MTLICYAVGTVVDIAISWLRPRVRELRAPVYGPDACYRYGAIRLGFGQPEDCSVRSRWHSTSHRSNHSILFCRGPLAPSYAPASAWREPLASSVSRTN